MVYRVSTLRKGGGPREEGKLDHMGLLGVTACPARVHSSHSTATACFLLFRYM